MAERKNLHNADTPLALLAALLAPAEVVFVSPEERRTAYAEMEQRCQELDTPRLQALLETIRRIRDLQALQFLRGLVHQVGDGYPNNIITFAAESLEELETRLRYEAEARTFLRPAERPDSAEDLLLRPASQEPAAEWRLLRATNHAAEGGQD